jgi:hypothetical protein
MSAVLIVTTVGYYVTNCHKIAFLQCGIGPFGAHFLIKAHDMMIAVKFLTNDKVMYTRASSLVSNKRFMSPKTRKV